MREGCTFTQGHSSMPGVQPQFCIFQRVHRAVHPKQGRAAENRPSQQRTAAESTDLSRGSAHLLDDRAQDLLGLRN